MDSKIRLYVEGDLKVGAEISLSANQTHYLKNVMRMEVGGKVLLFNGRDGEWSAEIKMIGKKAATLTAREQMRDQTGEPDIWLLFAPVKKAPIDIITEKATELGVACLWPVVTERTNVERVKIERLRANAIEAAEQCRRLTIPDIREPEKLTQVLAAWNPDRRLILMDETGQGHPLPDILSQGPNLGGDAILIGPEGGFSTSELDALRKLPFVTSASLGGRILRAETASLAALAIWQALAGDW